jgi:hypothetical protein
VARYGTGESDRLTPPYFTPAIILEYRANANKFSIASELFKEQISTLFPAAVDFIRSFRMRRAER